MFTVQLDALVQEPTTGRAFAATRSVELPSAPVPGLTVILSDVLHFQISSVNYDVRDISWFAECEDDIIRPPITTLEQSQQWYREAGFSITSHDLNDSPPRPRPRHLRPVR